MNPTMYRILYKNIEINEKKYFVPKFAEGRPAANAVLNGKLYEELTHKLVDYILKKTEMSTIHAGTFFGDMLPQFSSYCKETVYAFEPVLESYVMARHHVIYNNLENVMLFNAALSDQTGHAYIKTTSQNGSHLGGSSYISDSGQLVNTFKIDDMKMKEISVLHFDLEGHEDYAIQGALDKIRSEQPIILMEDSKRKDTDVINKIGYKKLLQTRLIDLWVTDKYQNLAVEALDYNKRIVDIERL